MRNKRRLFIIGASHFGRELESWLGLIPEIDRDWAIAGYLHTPISSSQLSQFPTNFSVAGDWKNFAFSTEDYVLTAVADPIWKERVWSHLYDRVSFYTYIAPSAVIGKFNRIGAGSILCPNTTLSTNVSLGTCVTINTASGVGHDAELGDFTSVMARATLPGGVKIGSKVFIGSAATLLPNVVIGDDAKVGAGSVVIRNVKEKTSVFGNPAQRIEE